MEVELPFKAEYAKTGRAKCKGCKESIGQASLRLAAMVQSAFHDGKQPNWFHEKCFFLKQRPSSVGDMENYENLRFEDQERLQKKIGNLIFIPASQYIDFDLPFVTSKRRHDEISTTVAAGSSGKGGKCKKRSKVESNAMKDFGIEVAKSGRAACRGCEQKILKDQIRIRKTVYDTEVGMKYGGQALWHHVECFAQLRSELGWFDTGENLPGFKSLKKDDQDEVKKTLPAIKSEDAPLIKKAKLEPKDEQDAEEEKRTLDKIKKQTKVLFEFRDNLKTSMKKQDMLDLLQRNGQEAVAGDSEKLLDQVADLLTFGAIAPCPECKGRQMLFQKSGYLCNGQLTEWTKCAKLVAEPQRTACKIPSALKKSYSFLAGIRKEPETRAFRYVPPSTATIAKNFALKKDDELDGPKVQRERPPFYNFQFAHIGLKDDEDNLIKRITKLGGKLTTKITDNTIAVFSTLDQVRRMTNRMEKAKELGIHIVPIEYINSVEANVGSAISYISSMTLCDWGTDPAARIPQEESKGSKSKSIYTKSVPKSMTLKVKDGLAVDPDSGLDDVAHVYTKNKDKYNVVLGLTDLQRNKNSYYKLQLLESDTKNKYWVFRSWGRIGTTIGGNKLESCVTLFDAINAFKSCYLDKTGNDFENRHNFQKVPGRMYPIDIEYADDSELEKAGAADALHQLPSKLQPEVQSLVKLLFDIDNMKRTMLEFDLDMEKMPLGKLSQKQIQSAYKVLTEIYNLIEAGGSNSSFIDATNRFYTLIPHNFGVRSPPLLDTTAQIEKLRQMLDSLMEIECAYSLLKSEDQDSKDGSNKEATNPLDKHYDQLKTKLEPLDKKSEEFAMLQKYVQNTHADTHRMYELEIVDIFKVARQGEARRYKPFKKLHNRRLLWHGSRLTNFAGILSHGLKIAPPEAPATGYMFGKGIYFADMVSKSANYCCTSQQNNTGLMLLSEVALGDMLECTAAKYVTQLPKNKHSTFGRGRTMPNAKESYIREDGVEIPLGKPTSDSSLHSSLLYNEFIVYDIAQVNIQYLFRINFNYKY